MILKKIIKNNYCLLQMGGGIRKIARRLKNKNNHFQIGPGAVKLQRKIMGSNNNVTIEPGCTIHNLKIQINGNNNQVYIGKNCVIGPKCSIWIEGSNSTVTIGEHTTMTLLCHINCQEDNRKITIGDDCMLSNNIIIRTSDSHPIYDIDTNQRLNPAKDVVIGSHVWIAPKSTIMKGANISNGCIIGSDTMVSKSVPENSLAVGHPAKVVKQNIRWTREKIF